MKQAVLRKYLEREEQLPGFTKHLFLHVDSCGVIRISTAYPRGSNIGSFGIGLAGSA